jgi:arabinosaccharide transport system substrate-binding protein
VDAIGFLDITDRLQQENIFQRINRHSFAPWTVGGRVYGLPMDVHPVMLAYRADLYEEAGIPIESARTWREFMEMSRPLTGDLTGDGVQDRYVLEMPQSTGVVANMMLLQAGGDLFDADGNPTMNSVIIQRVMTELVYWAAQSEPLTVDMPLFTGSGERLRGEGFILAWLTPDWRAARNMQNIPALSGKMKLMPLPLWEEGGARTSVWGGTMFGIVRSGDRVEETWEFAKDIYFNREVARDMWRRLMVVSPVKEFWDDPVYDEPFEYYSGQRIGQLFVEMAPEVPLRSSSVYYPAAITELGNALNRLSREAQRQGIHEKEQIRPLVEREMNVAQDNLIRILSRNIFHEK